MEQLKITSLQKKYLFYFIHLGGNMSISNFAELFNCSRINSKKILDRMVKLGVFYRENSKYNLTDVGKTIAEDIYSSIKAVSNALEVTFNLDEADALYYSELLHQTNDTALVEFLNSKFEVFKNLPREKTVFHYKDLEDILGFGEYRLGFAVYKHSPDSEVSSIPLSMANAAFEDYAILHLCENSHISLYTKSLEQHQGGYRKHGNLLELIYVDEFGEHVVSTKDGEIKISLGAFDKWVYFGNGVFSSNSWFKSRVSISMSNHTQKSNYLLILNSSSI